MNTTNLSVYGCRVNPHVDTASFCHRGGMDKPKTPLQKLFVERLLEEMEVRGISAAALAKLTKSTPHPVAQASMSRILAFKQDPTLEKVYTICEVLGIPPWYVLVHSEEVEQKIIRPPAVVQPMNVAAFPTYPKIFQQGQSPSKKVLAHKRKRA
jgi:transcriptional regulator with XRE-family HTH domain